MSLFELPVDPNIINSLSNLSLFNANMIAKKIDIGITNIDSLGISSKEKNVYEEIVTLSLESSSKFFKAWLSQTTRVNKEKIKRKLEEISLITYIDIRDILFISIISIFCQRYITQWIFNLSH